MRPVGVPVWIWMALAAAGSHAAAPPEDADQGAARAAVWKEQHLEFRYMGRTSRYSCNGLRDKVRAMLLDLGVRRDLKIVPFGCEDYDRAPIDSAPPRLKIVFSSPALPEAAATPMHAGDLAPIDASFERFTITSDAFRNMGIGDCELVQEFARQILPRLAARDLREDIVCVPYQPGASRFFVRGEILKALPRGEQSGQGERAGGGG